MKLERKNWPLLVIIGAVIIVVVAVSVVSGRNEEIKPSDTPVAVKETLTSVSVYQYTSDVIRSLSYANEAKNILSEMSGASSPDNNYSTIMDTLIATRKAESKLKQAAGLLSSYISTTNELINENSDNYRKTYVTLSVLLETSALQLETLLKSQDENGLADYISSSSKTIVDLDDAWKFLPLLSAELGYVLIDEERLVDDKLTYLKITSSEREELIKDLDDTFGDEIKAGLRTGQLAVVAAASLFREFLTSEWKSADE